MVPRTKRVSGEGALRCKRLDEEECEFRASVKMTLGRRNDEERS